MERAAENVDRLISEMCDRETSVDRLISEICDRAQRDVRDLLESHQRWEAEDEATSQLKTERYLKRFFDKRRMFAERGGEILHVDQQQDAIVDQQDAIVDQQDAIVDQQEDAIVDQQDAIVDQQEDAIADQQDAIVDQQEDAIVDQQDAIVDQQDAIVDQQDAIVDQQEDAIVDQQEDAIVDQQEDAIGESFFKRMKKFLKLLFRKKGSPEAVCEVDVDSQTPGSTSGSDWQQTFCVVEEDPFIGTLSVEQAPVDGVCSIGVIPVEQTPSIGAISGEQTPYIGAISGEQTPSIGAISGEQTPSIGVIPMEQTPSIGVRSMEQTPSIGVRSMEQTPSIGVIPMEQTPSIGVRSMEQTPSIGVRSMEQTPSIGVKSMEQTPSIGVRSMEQTPSIGVRSMERTPSIGVRSMERTPMEQALRVPSTPHRITIKKLCSNKVSPDLSCQDDEYMICSIPVFEFVSAPPSGLSGKSETGGASDRPNRQEEVEPLRKKRYSMYQKMKRSLQQTQPKVAPDLSHDEEDIISSIPVFEFAESPNRQQEGADHTKPKSQTLFAKMRSAFRKRFGCKEKDRRDEKNERKPLWKRLICCSCCCLQTDI